MLIVPNQKIGPYTLVRELGHGAFGSVWLADEHTEVWKREVALKLPLNEETELEDIKQEANTWLQAGNHPNLVPVLNADVYDGQVAIASEYVRGGTLMQLLRRQDGQVLSTEDALPSIFDILSGLEHLHNLKPHPLIHRDLKPANVLLDEVSGKTRITDFGISRVLKTTNQSSNVAGTPVYMAPEMFEGHYFHQSDLWAVGVILYQMLSGRLPFQAENQYKLSRVIEREEPAPLPDAIPSHIRNAISCAMQKNRTARYNSAQEMQEALRPSLKPIRKPIVLPPPQSDPPVSSTSMREPAALPAPVQSSPQQPTRTSSSNTPAPVSPNSTQGLFNLEIGSPRVSTQTSQGAASSSSPRRTLVSSPRAGSVSAPHSGVPGYMWIIVLAVLGGGGFFTYQAYAGSHHDSSGAPNQGNSSQGTSQHPSGGQGAYSVKVDLTPPLNPFALKQTRTNPVDGAEMMWIPAGPFLMGDSDRSNNPRHSVSLDGYWIYKNDVTVAQYKKFCIATGRQMPPVPDFNIRWTKEDHPIVHVSWYDAKAYCAWAGVSLPSEAQWEKAARGTDGKQYPWGNDWDRSKCANSVRTDGHRLIGSAYMISTVAVGKYAENEYGLTDMVGNVLQWCEDWYDASFWKSSQL